MGVSKRCPINPPLAEGINGKGNESRQQRGMPRKEESKGVKQMDHERIFFWMSCLVRWWLLSMISFMAPLVPIK
jgi:hypothetical protein